jgi:hypothetical protein
MTTTGDCFLLWSRTLHDEMLRACARIGFKP